MNNDLIMNILSFIDYTHLKKTSLISKQWYHLVEKIIDQKRNYNNTVMGFRAFSGPNINCINIKPDISAFVDPCIYTVYTDVNQHRYNNPLDNEGCCNTCFGNYNSSFGYKSLKSNKNGNNNIGIGSFSGCNIIHNNNICIGNRGTTDDCNVVRLGDQNVHKKMYIGGIKKEMDGDIIVMDQDGQLGTSKMNVYDEIKKLHDQIDQLQKQVAHLMKLQNGK